MDPIDQQRQSEFGNADRSGDVHHRDGTTTHIDSSTGPFAGHATNSDGRRYSTDMFGVVHRNYGAESQNVPKVVTASQSQYTPTYNSTSGISESPVGFVVGLVFGVITLFFSLLKFFAQEVVYLWHSHPLLVALFGTFLVSLILVYYFIRNTRFGLTMFLAGASLTALVYFFSSFMFNLIDLPRAIVETVARSVPLHPVWLTSLCVFAAIAFISTRITDSDHTFLKSCLRLFVGLGVFTNALIWLRPIVGSKTLSIQTVSPTFVAFGVFGITLFLAAKILVLDCNLFSNRR